MRKQVVVLVALCTALNLAMGTAVFMLKLPIYLDMVGTILCALVLWRERLVGFGAAASAGALSFLLGGVVNPYLPWFTGTVVGVAAITAFATSRQAEPLRTVPTASLRFVFRIVVFGVLTGVCAAALSAPVVVYLFGGVTGSGSAALVAFFLKTGARLLEAAVLSGLTAEPVDKTIQLLLAVLLLRATPTSFLKRFQPEGARGN
jgi:energy-coupling factor transport system substrate-specific component